MNQCQIMKKTNEIDNAARTNDENKEILNVSFKEFLIFNFLVMIFFVFVKKRKERLKQKRCLFFLNQIKKRLSEFQNLDKW